jgi:hypothetical protein
MALPVIDDALIALPLKEIAVELILVFIVELPIDTKSVTEVDVEFTTELTVELPTRTSRELRMSRAVKSPEDVRVRLPLIDPPEFALTGVYARAVVTSDEVRVTFPVLVLNAVTPEAPAEVVNPAESMIA